MEGIKYIEFTDNTLVNPKEPNSKGGFIGRTISAVKKEKVLIAGLITLLAITAIALFCVAAWLAFKADKTGSDGFGIGAAGVLALGLIPTTAALWIFAAVYGKPITFTNVPMSLRHDYVQVGSAFIYSPQIYNPAHPWNNFRNY